MKELLNTSHAHDISSGPDEVDIVLAELFSRVGERVRKAREKKGISRRVLSEISGVSPRYLAQLEAGAGNISIGLLKRVALALDSRMEWLVGDAGQAEANSRRFLELFMAANPAAKAAAIELLQNGATGHYRAQRICLLGLRGAGKSTLGRMAAERLNIRFVELNREIESSAGMAVGDIISLYGQDGYRQLESAELDKVIDAHERVVLAVGGGIVNETATYAKLQAYFHTVWVKASPQEHMSRVRAQGDERPMEGNPKAMEQLQMILRSRQRLYEKALATLDTTDKTKDASLDELVSIIDANHFLG